MQKKQKTLEKPKVQSRIDNPEKLAIVKTSID